MSKQPCLGVPVAAIMKARVTSVSGSYIAADTFTDDWIDATGHAKEAVSGFRHRTIY